MRYLLNNALSMILLIVLLFNMACSHAPPALAMRSKRIEQLPLRGTVVIDPGHGGHDSGAVGAKGLLEKEVTLDIALRLKRLLLKYFPAIKVRLTRSSDRFVSLEDRLSIANQEEADLFISLHVNSSESKQASGFEIFSLDVASDRHSERLAARENKIPGEHGKEVQFILADLMATSNRRESDALGHDLARGLKNQLGKHLDPAAIKDRGYNQAIFHVLFVKMPAVLTELFFISNPDDEKMLANGQARQLIARGLLLGIKNFLAKRVEHASLP